MLIAEKEGGVSIDSNDTILTNDEYSFLDDCVQKYEASVAEWRSKKKNAQKKHSKCTDKQQENSQKTILKNKTIVSKYTLDKLKNASDNARFLQGQVQAHTKDHEALLTDALQQQQKHFKKI